MSDDTNFNRIMEGLGEALEIAEGRAEPARVYTAPEMIDVKALRATMGMTQDQFAAQFGFTKGAVRDWEQNRREPVATARILLKLIEQEPEAVRRVLRAA